jgi:hypothetical protein
MPVLTVASGTRQRLVAVEIIYRFAIAALFVGTASAYALAPQDGNNLACGRASGDFIADEFRHHRQAQTLPPQRTGYGRAALLPVAIPLVTHFSAVTAFVHDEYSSGKTRTSSGSRDEARCYAGL